MKQSLHDRVVETKFHLNGAKYVIHTTIIRHIATKFEIGPKGAESKWSSSSKVIYI